MSSRKRVRPSPPPSGPALVRPLVGALLITLGGAVELGCGPKPVPPMAPPGDPPMAEPMPPPPMPDPSGGEPTEEPPMAPPPMPAPEPE